MTAEAVRIAEALDLRPAGVDRAIRTLSGGNQQKAMLARWLVHGCRVLLLSPERRPATAPEHTDRRTTVSLGYRM